MQKSKSDSLVEQIRVWADTDYEWDRENILDGITDLKFLANQQWNEQEKAQRELDKRPTLTDNRLIQPVKQVINDLRQARPSITVAGIGGKSDRKVAEIYAGLLREIHRKSRASWVYAMAAGHAAACGIGNFRILHDYTDSDSFEQEVKLQLIPYPFSVLWDADAREPDRSDAKRVLIFKIMTRARFEEEYPDAKPDSFDTSIGSLTQARFQWARGDSIIVAEVFWKEPSKRTLLQTQSGKVYDATDLAKLPANEPIVRKREVVVDIVKHCIVSGAEPLTEVTTWPGRHIPVVAVTGNEIPLENRTFRHGVIRFARDSQVYLNYWKSSAAEALGQGLKAPILATPQQIGPFREMWENANRVPRPYLLYEPDERLPQGKEPTRLQPPAPPLAFWEAGKIAADEIKAQTGIYDASLGARSNEVSGKAIDARAQAGEAANFEIADNLALSINHAGRVMVDLAPRIYDTERTIRILDDDEKEDFVPINVVAYGQDGQPVLVNDLGAGSYDVAVKLGPSQATRREQAAEGMIEFLKLLPDVAGATADIVAEAQEWPRASKFAERIRRTMDPNVLGDDAPEREPDPMAEEAKKTELLAMKAEVRKTTAKALLDESKATATRQKPMLDARRQALDEVKAEAESMAPEPGQEPPS